MTATRAWAWLVSHSLVAAGAVAAVLFLPGHCSNWSRRVELEATPVELQPTKAAANADREPLTPEEAKVLCAGLQPIAGGKALETSRKRRGLGSGQPGARSGQKFGLDRRGGELLNVVRVPASEEGGEVEETLEPGAPAPTLTFYPDKRKWFKAGSRWRVSALVGRDVAGGEDGTLVVPSVDWIGPRTGWITHGAGLTWCPAEALVVGYRPTFDSR